MMKWLLFFLAAPVFAQCTYSVSPPFQINLGANGTGSTQQSILVFAPVGCAWQYTTDSPSWITFSSGQTTVSTSGNDAIVFTAAPSTQPSGRTANIIVVGGGSFLQTINVTEAAAVCSLALQPAMANAPVTGTTGASFNVQTNCSWTASTSTPWLIVTAGSTGTGNGQVTYTSTANACVDGRAGTITISGQPAQNFTVNQDGSPGNLTLSPTSLTAPATASTGRVGIQTGNDCFWQAFSDSSWLHIVSASSGSGNGGLGYSIDANPSTQPRSGAIHLGSQYFAVTQQATPAPAGQLTAVTNGAFPNQASSAVSPGEIVSLFGQNIGPVAGAAYQLVNNAIPTSIAGVQVMFDSTPAPLLYVSSTQINAIVPYGIAGKTTTQVTATYQGAVSNAVSMQVQAATPGVFSQDRSGSGAGAILNQDFSVNSRLNPAAAGSIIAIYLTGTGVTDPASADGSLTGLTPPFPSVTLPVSVSIGGTAVPADQVWYSGGAPGSVAGLTQVNATVPSGLPSGTPAAVVVQLGDWQSQPGITLAVK